MRLATSRARNLLLLCKNPTVLWLQQMGWQWETPKAQ